MPAFTIAGLAAAIGLLLKVMGAKPALQKKIKQWRGKPSDGDTKTLMAYCGILNERRVFYAPYNVEVVESCLGSLSYVKDETEKTMAAISHAGAQAVLGAFLDDLRAFLDEWASFRTPRSFARHFDDRTPPTDERLLDFFRALGTLRERARTWISALNKIEPKAKAAKFTSS